MVDNVVDFIVIANIIVIVNIIIIINNADVIVIVMVVIGDSVCVCVFFMISSDCLGVGDMSIGGRVVVVFINLAVPLLAFCSIASLPSLSCACCFLLRPSAAMAVALIGCLCLHLRPSPWLLTASSLMSSSSLET